MPVLSRFCLLVIVISFSIFAVHASTDESELQVVSIYNLGFDGADLEDTLLLEMLNEQLAPYSVELEVTEQIDTEEQWITISLGDETIYIDARATIDYRLSASPVLYPNYTPPTCCSSNPFAVMQQYDFDETSYESIRQLIIGLALYQTSNYEASIEILTNARDALTGYAINSPSENFINFYLGNSWLMLDDYEQAIEHLTRIEYIGIVNTWDMNLAWLYLQVNDTSQALGQVKDLSLLDYETYIATAMVNSSVAWRLTDILSRRAQLYALAFDYDSAIADANAMIMIGEERGYNNRTLAEYYTLRGEIIFLIYEWDRVEDNLNMAIDLDPTYAPAYFQRGVLFYTMTRREDALSDFEMYLELAPDGIYAEQAQDYSESIVIELEALGG